LPYRPSRHLLLKCAATLLIAVLAGGILVPAAWAKSNDATPAPPSFLSGSPWSQIQGGPAHPGEVQPNSTDQPDVFSVPPPPAPPYEQAWRFDPTDSAGASGPVISGETVYALGEKSVYAIDLATGESMWSVSRVEGPMTVPAVTAPSGDAAPRLIYTQGTGDKTELVGLNTGSQQQV